MRHSLHGFRLSDKEPGNWIKLERYPYRLDFAQANEFKVLREVKCSSYGSGLTGIRAPRKGRRR